MKNTIFNTLLICCLLFLGNLEMSAQKRGTKQRTTGTTSSSAKSSSSYATIPNLYLGFGGGWNYQTGIFGLEVEVPFGEKLSADAGLGLAVFRYKASVGANYYFDTVAKGFSVNGGFTYASRLLGAEDSYEGVINTSDFEIVDENGDPYVGEAKLSINSAPTLDLGVSYNAKLGDKSKFVITLGYGLALNDAFTIETDAAFFNEAAQQAIKRLSPGGFMIGYKFIFGIGG